MESRLKILVLAWPGRSRDILVALLKTMPGVELFPAETLAQAMERFSTDDGPDLVVVDHAGGSAAVQAVLKTCQSLWPSAGRLFLVDNLPLGRVPLDAELALARNATAGELLSAVGRLSLAFDAPRKNIPDGYSRYRPLISS